MQQRLVHEVVVVLLQLRDLVGLDVRPGLFKSVSHDDLHQVIDRGFDLEILAREHIYFHLDLRKHAPSLKTTQLLCADITDPENWKLLNPRIVQEDDATQICVVYTSPMGGYFVAPGTYWFKFRRVSENAAGDDSATSAWVEVV